MKKIILLLFLTFIVSINKSNAQVNFNWAKQMVGNATTATSSGIDIALDASGNVYTIGHFSGPVDFDPGPGTFTLSGSGVYLSKLDAAGNFIWAKNVASGAVVYATSISLDAAGNIYIYGGFKGNVDFDPSLGIFNLIGSSNTNVWYDIFVSKLDATGNFVWVKQITGISGNGLAPLGAMKNDFSGNILFTGAITGTYDFDPSIAVFPLTSSSATLVPYATSNIFVCKLDPLGNFVWAKQMIGATNDWSFDIACDGSDNVYFTGHQQGITDMDPGPGTYNLVNAQAFLEKLDAAGNFVWVKTYVATGRIAIDVDGSGDVYLSGDFNGTKDLNPGPGVFNLTSMGLAGDVFVSKLSSSGNFIWAQLLGALGFDYATSIDVDLFGNTYVSSYTLDNGWDVIIAKVDALGNFTWAKQLGNVNSDKGGGIAVDASENIYLTGVFNSVVDFDPSPGTYTLATSTNTANSDAFVLKWSKCTSTVSPPTNATNLANQTSCSSNSATLSVTGLPQISWYAYPNITTAVGAGSVYLTPALSAGTYTYYTDNNVCSIGRTPVTLTVLPSPTITAANGTICSGQSFAINPSGASTYTFSGGSNVVTPTVSTSYSVTGTSTAGCISATPAIVSVSVNPTPTITVNNGAICAGQSFTLLPNGASTYTYSSGSAIVSPTASIGYSISGTNVNGCVTVTPAISNVTVNALPLIVAVTNNSLICSGQSVTLTSSGANTFTWSNSSTGNNSVVSPTVNTTYTVTGTDVNGCNNFATVTQSVSLCTGFVASSGVETNLITIYPNPSAGIFNVTSNYISENSNLEIYNSMGQLILSQKIRSKNSTVDLSKYADGLYHFKVNGNQQVFKVIKK
jgi:hypothetical protein